MLNNRTSMDKKKALLARKEQILQDLQYYETRIQEYSTKTIPTSLCYSSSDSEDDCTSPFPALEAGFALGELKQRERLLRTCLQATQELTGLAVLQSEVNVLVQDPHVLGERPVTEPGDWREVIAECRVDLVPFSITFNTHQPSKRFAPTSFRGLHVVPVKPAQEAELATSVLSELTRPSDAIEVLRSYAVAYRSRRNTLARLADKYTNNVFMERLPEGGFVLKCGNILSMSWKLENKLSAVAAFHHKMSFDLEYLDESYLKRIKLEHRKLADPSLETDERTLILASIITICLEAQTQAQDTYESMESDQESVRRLDKTTLSEDIDQNEDIDKRQKDKEVMAPPKKIPKKAKPKGKENMDDNRKSIKRASEVEDINTKKAKIDAVDRRGKSITDMVKEKDMREVNKVKKSTDEDEINEKGNDEVVDKEQLNQKGNDKVGKEQNKQKATEKTVEKKQVNQKKSDKVVDKPVEKSANNFTKQSKAVAKNVEKTNGDNSDKQKNNDKIDKNNHKKTEKIQTQSKVTDKNDKQKNNTEKDTDKVTAKNSKNTENNSNRVDDKGASSKHAKIAKPQSKTTVENDLNTEKVGKSDTNAKNGTNNVPQLKNTVEDLNPKTVVNIDKTSKDGPNDQVNRPKSNVDPKTVKTGTEKTNDKVNRPKSNADPKTVKSGTENAKTTKNSNNTQKVGKENKNDNQTKSTKNEKAPTNKPKEKNSTDKAIVTTEKTKTLPKNNTKIFQSKIVETENKSSDPKNKMVDPKNKTADPKNKTADPRNITADPKNTMADPKNKMADPKNTMADPKNKIVDPKNKTADPKNKRIEEKNIDPKNQMAGPKNKMADTKNKMGDPKNKIEEAKNKIIATKNKVKPKMVLPNHRSSIEGVRKSIIKPAVRKESQIPQKKLPLYAKVLQKHSVRVSPRMVSKLKSSSDTNIQAKLLKPPTNIPRLLKQSRPQSK